MEYINGTLKVKFELDNTSKPKPVAGPDDLLLLLVHHWAGDESVFPTEDNRHDLVTIMLFQSYTGGRPAEFVHSSKGKASQDPLGEAENTTVRKSMDKDYDDARDTDSYGNELSDDNDDDDNDDDNTTAEDLDKRTGHNDCYNSDNMDVTMPIDKDNCHVTDIHEPLRKCKAICYEDICLWVVQNPKQGERDVFAMEVHLRHHKGVDRKPKP